MGEQATGADDSRAVFFFDIDNCLYPRSKKIFGLMQDLINKFFVEHLSLSAEDALMLHQRYYQDYGLAILGLVQHNQVDPLEFNRRVDDALPLDDILKPDPGLRTLLETFNREKVKIWLFTNAFVTHGMRVVRLLGVDDLFEGITYCDYAANEIICKPYPSMFEKAEKESGASARETCYFVDDSYSNCVAAAARGWRTVHLVEPGIDAPPSPASDHQISHLSELRSVFPDIFIDRSTS